MIRYSVIIPVYNLENYIAQTLSLLPYDRDDTEIIIVNDGSTDASWRVVERFLESHDMTVVQLLSQPNAGVSVARNTGIEAAKGEYCIFIDGDDICSENMMETLDKLITDDTDQADMIVWRYGLKNGELTKESQEKFERSEYTGREFCKSLLSGENRIRIGSFAVKRKTIDDHNLRFTEGCAICEDVEFIYKTVLSSQRIVTTDEILYTYVKREGSAMNLTDKPDMRLFQAPEAIRRLYGYVIMNLPDALDDHIEDSLKYGLYITHCMHSFESCCRRINSLKGVRDFLDTYFEEYSDIEKYIKNASVKMKFRPTIYSEKRLKLFLYNRRLYTWYIYMRNKKQRQEV